MMQKSISPDTQVTLLLCSKLGQSNETSSIPLNTTEYAALCQWLRNGSMNLKNLFEPEVVDQYAKISRLEPKRLHALLNRGGALALAVEDWSNKGIWIISQSDKNYPERLIERLSNKAPSLLYGVGNSRLLSNGGLAVVGSRDISERAILATRQIGNLCVKNGIQLISGGARGVDNEGMQAVLENGGYVIGFVADSLLKMSVNGKFRQGLKEQRLVLVIANDPKTPFKVGNAMARNKFVYCLSDWALVIASSYNEGGTWAGATENMKNKWVPMFVRNDVDVPEGNYRLIDKGAIALPPESFSNPEKFMIVLKNTQRMVNKPCVVCDLTTTYSSANDANTQNEISGNLSIKAIELINDDKKIILQKSTDQEIVDLLPVVWPYIEKELADPKTDKELADGFNVELKQMRSWLSMAIKKGDVKKLSKPIRYVRLKNKDSLDIWIEN
jgi:predicted Rossmann fold nucleotide-binding protein DprA/Smf involved in DNA uptake